MFQRDFHLAYAPTSVWCSEYSQYHSLQMQLRLSSPNFLQILALYFEAMQRKLVFSDNLALVTDVLSVFYTGSNGGHVSEFYENCCGEGWIYSVELMIGDLLR